MANTSIPNPVALLHRGMVLALLVLAVGCATHMPHPQYKLANVSPSPGNTRGVCVQVGITPVNSQTPCKELTQPHRQHHVEPLPLDEFGYLFPPLKPEKKLAAAHIPMASTTGATLATATPVEPEIVPVAPISQHPLQAPRSSALVQANKTPAAPVQSPATSPKAAVRYAVKTVHFSTQEPFRLNSAHLTRRNRTALLDFINSLEKYRGVESILITGHTDRSGPANFNNWLSDMRAKSAQLWLLSWGVDPRTTHRRGVGSREPRPHAHHAADNRYVDLKVVVRTVKH